MILFVAAACKETSHPGWNHADCALSVFGGQFQPRQAPLQSAICKHNLPAPRSWVPSVTSRPGPICPPRGTLPMAPFAGCMSSNTSLALCPNAICLAPIPDPCRQPTLQATRQSQALVDTYFHCRRQTIEHSSVVIGAWAFQRWEFKRLVIVTSPIPDNPKLRAPLPQPNHVEHTRFPTSQEPNVAAHLMS